MRRVFRALLAASVALNTWLLVQEGGERLREDRAIAAERTLGGKYARILGSPDLAPQLDELLALAGEVRRRGDERMLLVLPPQFGAFLPIARHHAFPAQVLDQPPGERGRDELLAEARRLGARTALWFRPARGWQMLETQQ